MDAEVKTDSTALVAVQNALTEFDKIDAGLIALETKHAAVVFDCKTTAGMASAVAARREIRDPRYQVESIRKAAKAPITALGKNIDERARYITGRLVKIEDPIDAQIKAEESRREAIRQEEARKEAARLAAIDEAIALWPALPGSCMGLDSAHLATAIEQHEAKLIDDTTYAEHKARAQFAKDNALAKLRQMHTAAVAQEMEAKRLADERAELDRRKREQDERDRVAAEEQRKRDAEAKAERERQAAEERKRRDAIAAEERASRERIEAQERAARLAREEEDRKAQEIRDAETARVRAAQEAEGARIKAAAEALEERQRAARLAQEERERAEREKKDAVEREERRQAETAAALKAEQERKARAAQDERERQERLKAQRIEDGRASLQAFVDTFGEVHEFALIAITVKEWLQSGAVKATKARKAA